MSKYLVIFTEDGEARSQIVLTSSESEARKLVNSSNSGEIQISSVRKVS